MNLLKDTLEILRSAKRKEGDVLWVGNNKFWFTWNEFKKLAKNADFDGGYGAQEVAVDLIIVGKDFWMTRGEYDGSEWWEYHKYPTKPPRKIRLTALTVHQSKHDPSCGWENLTTLNFGEKE